MIRKSPAAFCSPLVRSPWPRNRPIRARANCWFSSACGMRLRSIAIPPLLDALVSSRFVNTEWDGELSDKQKFLADIKDPRFKPAAANIQDVKMNFFGDTAVVTGIYHTQGTYQGKPTTTSDASPTPGCWIRQMAVRRQPYQPAEEVSLAPDSFRIAFRQSLVIPP